VRVFSFLPFGAAFFTLIGPVASGALAEPESYVTMQRPLVVAARETFEREPKRSERATIQTIRLANKKSTRETLGGDEWWLNTSGAGPIQIVVSVKDQQATVYAGGKAVAQSRVSTGKRGHSTPTGLFSILQKNRYHRSNIYSNAPMPFMQRLTWSGIALHASNSVPDYPASHGCVRLPHEFARKLFKFTERGAHVVIAQDDKTLNSISHRVLFQPVPEPAGLVAHARMADEGGRAETDEPRDLQTGLIDPVIYRFPSTDGPEGRYPSAVVTVSAPEESLGSISVASLRLSRTDADEPEITPAVPKSISPIRILVTRRTGRELIADVQTMLNQLGFESGDVDGYMGSVTGAAIQKFQEAEGLTPTGAMSADLVTALYHAAGKGKPLLGHIYVRQDFKDLLDAPIGIDEPEKALGTHVFTAQHFDENGEDASWTAMTLEDTPQNSRFSFLEKIQIDAEAMAPDRVLDRLVIPSDIRTRISALLTPGSSLAISDNGISRETGRGTDFVILTRYTN